MTVRVDKLIILDRDGVINQDRDDYVKSCEEWIPIPNSLGDCITYSGRLYANRCHQPIRYRPWVLQPK